MDLNLEIKKYRHVWCFGCSFTSHIWKTWADHLSETFGNVTNRGRGGAGNYYIFQKILEEYSLGNLKSNDLIMVCWTGHFRLDNKFKDKWYTAGNLLTQDYWSTNIIKKYFDPKYFLERDLYFILAINEIFKDRIINFSMGDINLFNQYGNYRLPYDESNQKIKKILDKFYPSFYKVLWNNDYNNIKTREDKHPTEEEHKLYLKKIFHVNF